MRSRSSSVEPGRRTNSDQAIAMPTTDERAADAMIPIHSALTDGCSSTKRDSSNVGWRKCSSHFVTPGMNTIPPITDSTASGAIAIRIGSDCSATWCSGPG